MMAVVLDLALTGLLLAACAYSMMLSRKLAALRKGQAELKSAIEAFDASAQTIQSAMQKVESIGLVRARETNRTTEDAQALFNDLSVMTAAGARVADRLESALDDVRRTGRHSLKDEVTSLSQPPHGSAQEAA